MYRDLREILTSIAKDDNEREEQFGAPCPAQLKLLLASGHAIEGSLVDGENSVDESSIELVVENADQDPDRRMSWFVPIASIVAVRRAFPRDSDIEAARSSAAVVQIQPKEAANG